MGVTCAERGGCGRPARRWLPGIIAGETVLAVAYRRRHERKPEKIACRAEKAAVGLPPGRAPRTSSSTACGGRGGRRRGAPRAATAMADGVTLVARVPKDARGGHRAQRGAAGRQLHRQPRARFDGVRARWLRARVGEVDGGRAVLNRGARSAGPVSARRPRTVPARCRAAVRRTG
jgi:hypothetical protein